MLSFWIAGLLGAVALGAIIIDHNDNDDDTSEDPETEGQNLTYDGNALLEGTEGDDTLAAGQDDDLAPDTIDLLGGDDEAIIEQPYGITVNGGDGVDTLTSSAVGNTLNGDAGDDVLSGIDANDIYGGDGDDSILFDRDAEYNDDTATVDGGDGDDAIVIRATAGLDLPDAGGAVVSGGDGADSFIVSLDVQDTADTTDDDDEASSTIARITDFVPGEDLLEVSISRDDSLAGRDVDEITLDRTENEDGFESVLTLHIAATEDAVAATVQLVIQSTVAISLSDIVIDHGENVTLPVTMVA